MNSRHIHARILLLLATGLFLLPACRRGPASKEDVYEPSDTAVVVAKPIATQDGTTQTFRLTQDVLNLRQNTRRDPLVIPLDKMRVSLGMRTGGADDRAAIAKMIEKTPEYIRIQAGDKYSSVETNRRFLASHYNVLEVTMRADRGSRCILSWSSDLEPSVLRNEGVGTPIFPDNELHTYRLALDPYNAETWLGTIKSIAFYPSDQPANVEVRELKFLYEPPEGPPRVSLETQTHEALYGTQPPWSFTVPEHGRLDVHLGMHPRSWENGRNGEARFIVELDAPDGTHTLSDEILSPATVETQRFWLPLNLDLSQYAGETVTLNLRVEHGETPDSDYAFWGDPMIYSGAPNADATPVILIVCDTVRADHLSCYGYLRETSPNLDAFAKEAVLFENAIANETWTLPSHGTIFTGLYPKNHGMTANANLPESTVTLTEALRGAGYLTAGYTGFSFWLYPWRGFSHGFDIYNIPDWRFRAVYDTRALLERWIDNHPVPNLFVFFHNFDAHSKPARQYDGLPYGPDDPNFLHFAKEFDSPPTFEREGRDQVNGEDFMLSVDRGEITITPDEVAYCIALYDDCIRMVDQNIQDFFDKLKSIDLYDRALIIVTADHGEEFGEHGNYGHGNVYEPSAHVPLLIRFPYGEHGGARYPHVVQLADLYPTILGTLGIPLPGPVDGQDLSKLLDGEKAPLGKAYVQRMNQKAIRTDDVKLIRNVRDDHYELYDMKTDRAEQHNLYTDAKDSVNDLQSDLLNFYRVSPEGWHFAYSLVEPDWRGDLEVAADSALDTAILTRGWDRQNMILKGRSVIVRMGREGDDELILRTTDPTTKLVVTVKAESEFSLAIGDAPIQTGTEFTIPLDPSTAEYARPQAELKGKNVLRIWYVPPSTKRSAAKPLPEDVVEELRALGYTGE